MASTRVPLIKTDSDAQDMADKLEMSTAEIGLRYARPTAWKNGVFSPSADLLGCTREDLLAISNFGEKTLEEVYKALEGVGFYRKSRQAAAVKKVVAAHSTAVNRTSHFESGMADSADDRWAADNPG